MKIVSSVLCAVVVFGLGLSAALSPRQVLAAVERVHPANMCVRGGGANITRIGGGSIVNLSQTQRLGVLCDVVNKVDLNVAGNHPVIQGGVVSVTDMHPSLDITCVMIQATASFSDSSSYFRFISKATNGAAANLKFLSYDAPDPGGFTGLRSNNYFACTIPPAVPGGLSRFHFYSVEEEY